MIQTTIYWRSTISNMVHQGLSTHIPSLKYIPYSLPFMLTLLKRLHYLNILKRSIYILNPLHEPHPYLNFISIIITIKLQFISPIDIHNLHKYINNNDNNNNNSNHRLFLYHSSTIACIIFIITIPLFLSLSAHKWQVQFSQHG